MLGFTFLLWQGPDVKHMEDLLEGLDQAKVRAKNKHKDQQRGGEDRQNKNISMW